MNYQYKWRVDDTMDLTNSKGKQGLVRNDFISLHS